MKTVQRREKRPPRTLAEEKAAAFGFKGLGNKAARKILAGLGIPVGVVPPRIRQNSRISLARLAQRALNELFADKKETRPTICANGHRITPQNTYIDANGARHCRRCLASCF